METEVLVGLSLHQKLFEKWPYLNQVSEVLGWHPSH